jgi:hypothetical protein
VEGSELEQQLGAEKYDQRLQWLRVAGCFQLAARLGLLSLLPNSSSLMRAVVQIEPVPGTLPH